MWFWLSLGAFVFWSGSDLFSKLGCRSKYDKNAYLKMVTAVGFVMGLHALYEIVSGTEITFKTIVTYLPVSLLYIGSMAVGYLGLKYIELSISSPICNSSGALVLILLLCVYGASDISPLCLVAVALVCIGVVFLGVAEMSEDENARSLRQYATDYKYAKSFTAILLPVIYCLLDALGTFADSIVLRKLDEDSANVAYELTFFAVGVGAFVYTKFINKSPYKVKKEIPKYIGAVCETVGQFFYIYAISDETHVVFAAPIISAYCVLSVVWGRIFLKEKLSFKHYAAITVTAAGIILLGIFEG